MSGQRRQWNAQKGVNQDKPHGDWCGIDKSISHGWCHDGHTHHDDRGHVIKLSRDIPWQLGLENLDKAEWKLDECLSLEKQREL